MGRPYNYLLLSSSQCRSSHLKCLAPPVSQIAILWFFCIVCEAYLEIITFGCIPVCVGLDSPKTYPGIYHYCFVIFMPSGS